jgi:bifunctional DNA-binding transcriptional regulator/antitoxin component of YhaV-PrlF toxin-antitoxin module
MDIEVVMRYALPMGQKVKDERVRGSSTISSKNQVTIPVDALRAAGLSAGDRIRASVDEQGRIVFTAAEDPVSRFSGSMTGQLDRGRIEALRDEWD